MKILLFSVLIILTDGANILILHPIYSGSHEHVLRTVGEHLVQNRGHNVTQVNVPGLHGMFNLSKAVVLNLLGSEDP